MFVILIINNSRRETLRRSSTTNSIPKRLISIQQTGMREREDWHFSRRR